MLLFQKKFEDSVRTTRFCLLRQCGIVGSIQKLQGLLERKMTGSIMFADISHSTHLPAAGRFAQLFWRLANALQSTASRPLPSELQRLPDHLLRDIGVERADLPP